MERRVCHICFVFQIEEEQEERGADRLLFSFLTLISKLSKHCGLLELSKPHDTLCHIWGKGPTHTTSPFSIYTHIPHAHSHFVFVFFTCAPAGHIEAHLRYPHCWVWLTASQLFGQLFAAHQAEQLLAVWSGEGGDGSPQPSATAFITSNLDKKVRPMTAAFLCNDIISGLSFF